jgi:hypothetical protein
MHLHLSGADRELIENYQQLIASVASFTVWAAVATVSVRMEHQLNRYCSVIGTLPLQ